MYWMLWRARRQSRVISKGRDSLAVCLGHETNARISQPDVVAKATLLEVGIEVDGRKNDIDMRSDVLGKVVLITGFTEG
jgi:hypothetical protein